jgi:glycosyltransferase involved in cell wall biosynthesis
LFQGSEDRDPDRLIWTSNPNRGLANAVRIFRQLRRRYPALTLHIYGRSAVYGWGTEDPLHERFFLPDADEPGVVLHDPLPKPQLARELMKSWCMPYFSTWPETFSLACTEAQCAGVPVLATPYGALPDTVRGGVLTYDAVGAFTRLREDPKEWERLSLLGRDFTRTLDWDAVALTWVRLIKAIQTQRRAEGRLK